MMPTGTGVGGEGGNGVETKVELATELETETTQRLRDRRRLSLLWSLTPRQIRFLDHALCAGAATWEKMSRGVFPKGLRMGSKHRVSLQRNIQACADGHRTESLSTDPLSTELPSRVVSSAESVASGRFAEWARAGICLTVRGERGFPLRLLQIADPPNHLFFKGRYWQDAELLARPRIGIIGSRAASRAGSEMTRRLARDLTLADCVIVSGMARGIDAAAHRGALDAGGVSVAVFGTGLDRAYPPENRDIFKTLPLRGGTLSEFPPDTPPLPHHFPRRNRLLAGWVDLLVVVEGGERSGARSTVDFALDQGREVAAFPRDVLLEGAALPNRLLFDGARLIRSAEDVLHLIDGFPSRSGTDVLPWTRSVPDSEDAKRRGASAHFLSEPAFSAGDKKAESLPNEVLRCLESGEITSDQLAGVLTQVAWPRLQAVLAELEIRGQLERLPGDRIRRRASA